MPFVFLTSIFPFNKANDIAKLYLSDLKEYRSAIRELSKEIVPNAIKATKDGIESISVHDIKEGKLEDFLRVQQKYLIKYFDVEGYKYSIEVRLKTAEALDLLGLKLPE